MLGAHRDGAVDPSKQRRGSAYTTPIGWVYNPEEDKNGNILKPENYVYEFGSNNIRNDEVDVEDGTNEKNPKHHIRATKSYLNDLMSSLDKIEVPTPKSKIDQTEIKHGMFGTQFRCNLILAVVKLYQLQKN